MASYPQRYAIYFADLNPTVGAEIRKVRPVVVVSQDESCAPTVAQNPIEIAVDQSAKSSSRQRSCYGRRSRIKRPKEALLIIIPHS